MLPLNINNTQLKNLEKSAVGKDFIKHYPYVPSADKMLDYRLALQDLLELPFEHKEYPDDWVKSEIKAVDTIMDLHHSK